MSSLPYVSALALIFVFAVPRSASAQSESDAAVGRRRGPVVAAWGSVGLGPGNTRTQEEGRVAGVVRANVSVGPWLLTYRGSDVGPFFDSGGGVSDKAVLAGMRSGGHRLFGSAALGYARATPYSQSDNSSVDALAYDAALHANAYVVGLAFSLSGAVGASRASYSAVTVGVELGWFGW